MHPKQWAWLVVSVMMSYVGSSIYRGLCTEPHSQPLQKGFNLHMPHWLSCLSSDAVYVVQQHNPEVDGM
jgi:hypothetical protein